MRLWCDQSVGHLSTAVTQSFLRQLIDGLFEKSASSVNTSNLITLLHGLHCFLFSNHLWAA